MKYLTEREARAAMDRIGLLLHPEAYWDGDYLKCPECGVRQHHVGGCPCHPRTFRGLTRCQACGEEYLVA